MSNGPRVVNANRNWGSDDSETSILHVDMDAFYASIEVARKPALKGKPVVVGGGERSVVLAATYEARALGIKSAMPVSRAKALGTKSIFINPDLSLYREISSQIMELFHQVTPQVEQLSVDEAFLDVAGARRLLGSPVEIGAQLRREIEKNFGITASVGIASNKFVAKLASTHCKPNGMMLIPAVRSVDFVQCLPVEALWGVGQKTALKLANWGIETVAQLAHCEVTELSRMVGSATARHLHALAWAKDSREVVTTRSEKSIGAERTYDTDVFELDQILQTLLSLADECGSRVRKRGLVARTISIKLRNSDFETVNRSVTLTSPTNSTKAIFDHARELILSLKRQQTTRLVGLRLENLENESETSFQDTLFESKQGTLETLGRSERIIDEIRAKFGDSSIERASQSGIRLSRLQPPHYP